MTYTFTDDMRREVAVTATSLATKPEEFTTTIALLDFA